MTADASEAQGQQILDAAIHDQIAGGNVDAANPVVVFGYSQSSAIASLTISEQLHNRGVPSNEVHFVLVGDTSAPNGGLLERFDVHAGTDPALSTLVNAAYTTGLTDTPHPSLLELLQGVLSGFANYPISDATLLSPLTSIVNDFTATLSADDATLLPVADAVTALVNTLPAWDAGIFVSQFEAGNGHGAGPVRALVRCSLTHRGGDRRYPCQSHRPDPIAVTTTRRKWLTDRC